MATPICNSCSSLSDEVSRLKDALAAVTTELNELRHQLLEKDGRCPSVCPSLTNIPGVKVRERLDNASIARYSRQLILPELGVKGQLKLSNSCVLIVGAGGLGCPAAIYLAAAGIGCIGLVDYDEVELSNLHRQILHTESRVGITKSTSIATACKALNSSTVCKPYHLALDSSNAMEIISDYDVIVDATDNVATRYLLNDACVLSGKPLVSGSALRFEGQLTVYNCEGGPCYRCLYPTPPPPETVTNCSDGGVLGVVPGLIGCCQALEVIKLTTGMGNPASYSQRMLLLDALDGTFRTIKLRGRKPNCVLCGDQPSITQLIDYEQFCGAKASDKSKSIHLLEKQERLSPKEYHELLSSEAPHLLIDVRLPVEQDICQLPKTINIPLGQLSDERTLQNLRERISGLQDEVTPVPVVVVCRQGNDSQTAVQVLKEKLADLPVMLKDIRTGLNGWAKTVDSSFPQY